MNSLVISVFITHELADIEKAIRKLEYVGAETVEENDTVIDTYVENEYSIFSSLEDIHNLLIVAGNLRDLPHGDHIASCVRRCLSLFGNLNKDHPIGFRIEDFRKQIEYLTISILRLFN